VAHFIGYVTGRSKTTASRLGTKSTGITARAQGWDIGARVTVNHVDGRDIVSVELTGGSNEACHAHSLGTFERSPIDPNAFRKVGR
jgi:hypothetical protein